MRIIKIKLLDLHSNRVLEFSSWREAHLELEPCADILEPCEARTLEHYSDFKTHRNDFGVLIGKDCVLEVYELVAP